MLSYFQAVANQNMHGHGPQRLSILTRMVHSDFTIISILLNSF